jgi:hypothetical protein
MNHYTFGTKLSMVSKGRTYTWYLELAHPAVTTYCHSNTLQDGKLFCSQAYLEHEMPQSEMDKRLAKKLKQGYTYD